MLSGIGESGGSERPECDEVLELLLEAGGSAEVELSPESGSSSCGGSGAGVERKVTARPVVATPSKRDEMFEKNTCLALRMLW